jgi:GlpG protein
MRQAGVIPTEAEARRFVDYLLTQQIEAKTDPSADGWAIWIYDESQLALGKDELQQFLSNPQDVKYSDAAKKADALRRDSQAKDRQAARNIVEMRHRWASPGMRGPRLLTFSLMAACVFVGFVTKLGKDRRQIDPYLRITSDFRAPTNEELEQHTTDNEPDGANARAPAVAERLRFGIESLPEVRRGEVWRLVTPIFIHMSIMHLLFNMYWLFVLGGMVEDRYGSLWLMLFVIVTAVVSNLAQFFWSGPFFGGMSGVGYALFGYIWMKSKFDPAAGLYIGERDVFLMLLWFVVCFTGWVGPVANAAHAGGLIAGVILGYVPRLLRR